MCTKRWKPCACGNRCWALLRFARQGAKEPISLFTGEEPLGCPGDEGSVCCPFEFSGSKRSIAVIASGTWLPPERPPYPDEAPEPPHLDVEKLCKLK